jgi:hypothetical protein
MFDRYWRSAIATGCGAALFLCTAVALAQQSRQPALKSQPVPEAGQQQRAQDGKSDPAPKDDTASDLLTAIKGIEAAIREHVAKEDKEESERKEEREYADLKAQQDMAAWAKCLFWATVASLILTCVGLYLIWRTLRYTRDAARAARESVREARRATRVAEITNRIVARNSALEYRAYLSVIPAGINELIGRQVAMGHVDVKNVGKIPAHNVWLHVRMTIADRDDRKRPTAEGPDPFEPPKDPKERDKAFTIDRTIQPGTQMRQGAAEKDLIPVAVLRAEPDRYVYVWGVVYYDDGTRRRYTKFRHRYHIASHTDIEDWNVPAKATREIIAVDKARYHSYGNSAN